MLRPLLIFITMSVVYCQTDCPDNSAYSLYPNNYAQPLLVGYFTIFYTSKNLAECQRVKYAMDANNVTRAVYQKPNCCYLRTFGAFNPGGIEYSTIPLPCHAEDCPPGVGPPNNGTVKIVAQIGTGDNICFAYSNCQPNSSGLSVMCKGEVSTLVTVVADLLGQLKSLGPLVVADILALIDLTKFGCVSDDSNECYAAI